MATGDRSQQRAGDVTRAAALSVISNSLLTCLKLVAGFMTGSISVLSEGVHSGNDLVAALLALFSVRKSGQPADEKHAYGHGKFEALSGAIEAALIILAAFAILYSALRSLAMAEPTEMLHGPAIVVMGLSTVVNIVVSTHLYRVAIAHDSMALEADAAHLRADVWSSAGVFAGLGIAAVLSRAGRDVHWMDPGLAVVVAAIVLTQGWGIARRSIDQLLDRSLPAEEVRLVEQIIEEHAGQFEEFHKLRTRRAGHERHVDLHLVVRDQMSVAQAHELADHLEKDIAGEVRNAMVMIHLEPASDSPTVVRRTGDGQQGARPKED